MVGAVPNKNTEYRDAGRIGSLQEFEPLVVSEHSKRMIRDYIRLGTKESDTFQIPTKPEFDPVALRSGLANAVLYDLQEEGKVIFRLVGDKIRPHFNANPIGRNYLDFLPPERRSAALSAFRNCVEHPCAMLSRHCNLLQGHVTHFFEAAGFPFLDADRSLPARYLLFVDADFEPAKSIYIEDSEFPFSVILERHFVDLGSGTPKGFVDPVRTDIQNPFPEWLERASA